MFWYACETGRYHKPQGWAWGRCVGDTSGRAGHLWGEKNSSEASCVEVLSSHAFVASSCYISGVWECIPAGTDICIMLGFIKKKEAWSRVETCPTTGAWNSEGVAVVSAFHTLCSGDHFLRRLTCLPTSNAGFVLEMRLLLYPPSHLLSFMVVFPTSQSFICLKILSEALPPSMYKCSYLFLYVF